MLVLMNEAANHNSSTTTSRRISAPAVSSSPMSRRHPRTKATRAHTAPITRTTYYKEGGKVSPTPNLTESPPHSLGNLNSYHGSNNYSNSSNYRTTSPNNVDLEASEASEDLDDSLHDFLDDLATQSPVRRAANSLHSSMSALQTRAGLLHKQGSISSLPLTVDESSHLMMRKRSSAQPKVLNWTGGKLSPLPRNQEPPASPKLLGQRDVRLNALTNALTTKRNSISRSDSSASQSKNHSNPKTMKPSSSMCLLLLLCSLLASILLVLSHKFPDHLPFWFHVNPTARRQANHQPLLQLLSQQEGIDLEALQDPSTPAYKALDWMANDDALPHDAQAGPVQRWALATLYFATHQQLSEWNNETHWMMPVSACQWHGVKCEILSQSDWFDATLGTAGSSSDALGALEEEGESDKPKEPKEDPVLDVVSIHLSNNNLHGRVPAQLRHLPQLMTLDLSHNHLTGSLPQTDALGHYLRLTHLKLDHNQLTGELPAAIGWNMILKQLQLDHNFFRGTIPQEWGTNLRNLREWTMGTNFVTGTIPATLGGLKHLQVLEWNDNQLTGPLPFSLCQVTTLKTVKLEFNGLAGSIPSEFILSARDLEVLNLGHNQLTGHVPDVMQHTHAAPKLKQLHVEHNHLTGRLPKSLGHITKLTSLRFDHNQFTGWIPVAWQRLTELNRVSLQYNKLGGSLPTQLVQLTKLEEFQFTNNLLHPKMPNKMVRKLPLLHYHAVGFYTSDARDKVMNRDMADEQSRMRRQAEMQKDIPQKHEEEKEEQQEGKAAVEQHEQEKPEENVHAETPLLSLNELYGGMPNAGGSEHHFDEEEM